MDVPFTFGNEHETPQNKIIRDWFRSAGFIFMNRAPDHGM